MAHIVTKESLQAMIQKATPDMQKQIVGRALVVLFERQTEHEKSSNTTNVDNGVGFTGADGKSGVISAKTFLKNKTLLDWQLERWLKVQKSGHYRITKYWKQLDDAAQKKDRVNG